MSTSLLAEFADPDALTAAARRPRRRATGSSMLSRRSRSTGWPTILDIRSHLASGWSMLLAGLRDGADSPTGCNGTAPSTTIPSTSAARPLNSWPVFLLVPFEVGMLAAAIAGIIALFWRCGLPAAASPRF